MSSWFVLRVIFFVVEDGAILKSFMCLDEGEFCGDVVADVGWNRERNGSDVL